jgi:hypothetical protein
MTAAQHTTVTTALLAATEPPASIERFTAALPGLQNALRIMQRTRPTGSAGGRTCSPAQTAARKRNGKLGGAPKRKAAAQRIQSLDTV